MQKQTWKLLIKRALSVFLTITVLFSSVDFTAFATETNTTETAETTMTTQEPETAEGEDDSETSQKPDRVDGTGNDDSGNGGDIGESDETVSEENGNDGTDGSGETKKPEDGNESTEMSDPDGMDDELNPDDNDEANAENGEPEDNSEDKEMPSVSIEQKDMSIEASSGMGSLLLSDIQLAAQENENEEKASYAISEIEVIGDIANVSLHVEEKCTVVVGIYEEESGKPYAFGYAQAQRGESSVDVVIETDSMPAYFVVRGYVVDTESLRPLSEEYFSNMYTKVMQDFLKKTTEDFASDKVVNLDEDDKTNFAVVKDGSVLIRPTKDSDGNVINELISYDEATNTYTFANVDENITNLTQGEVFVYQRDGSDILIIKIKSIVQSETEDGNSVVDIAAYTDELDVDDVFEYVKIEKEVGTAEAGEVDPASCPAGVEYVGRDTAAMYANQGTASISGDMWKLDLAEAEKEGSLGPVTGTYEGKMTAGLNVTITLEYYFAIGVWNVDLSIKADVSTSGEIKLDGKLEIPLAEAIEVEDDIITVKYIPRFVVDVYFEGAFSIGGEATFGIIIGNQKKSGPYGELKLNVIELSAKFGGYVGFDFNPEVDVKGIFHAGLEDTGIHLGVEASLEGGLTGSVSTKEDDVRHDCGTECMSGEFYLKVPFDGKLRILKFKEYDLKEVLEIEGDRFSFTIGEFFYSFKHNLWGWGECEYKEYNTTTQVRTAAQGSKDYRPVADAQVGVLNAGKPIVYSLDASNDVSGDISSDVLNDVSTDTVNGDGSLVTNSNGMVKLWLHAGENTLYADKDGLSCTKVVEVDGARQTLELPSAVKDVFIDQDTCAAITEDGRLYMWGYNNHGWICNGTGENQLTPIEIPLDNKNVKSFCMGNWISAAITEDGSLYMWGWNQYGAIGNGREYDPEVDQNASDVDQLTPFKVPLGDEKVKSVSFDTVGTSTVAAITENGKLYMWGYNSSGQIGNGTKADNGVGNQLTPIEISLDGKKVETVRINNGTSIALTEDGSIYAWGKNGAGLLGNGTTESQLTPIKVSLDNKKVKSFSLNEGFHSFVAAITEDGKLYMWGENSSGQIGNGTTTNQLTPLEISLDEKNVKSVSLSTDQDVTVVTGDGSLYCWGGSANSYIGDGTNGNHYTPVQILSGEKVKEAYGNYWDRMALTEDGRLYVWGMNASKADNKRADTPIQVLENVVSFGMPEGSSIYWAATEDGSFYMWGANDRYQLGNGTKDRSNIPIKISVNNKKIKSIYQAVPYGNMTAAIMEDGRLYMWGRNQLGSMGNGSTNGDAKTPYRVSFASANETDISYNLESADVILSGVREADNASGNTADFSGLIPNGIYNVYAMKSREEGEYFGNGNLLYMGQAVSDENGSLSIVYEMREAYDDPEVFCVGLSKIDLASAEAVVPDIEYNGAENSPEVRVVCEGKRLVEGVDYILYGDCAVTEVGEYKILIKGCGGYCGEREMPFHVNKGNGGDNKPGDGDNTGGDDKPGDDDKEHDDVLPEDKPEDGVIPEGLWIAGLKEGYDYTGTAIKPEIRVYDHKTLLTEKTDYTISYKNNIKANNASDEKKAPTITVTGKGNYTGKDTKTFKIEPLDISVSESNDHIFEADDMALIYSGKEQKPVPALLWNGKKLKNKTDYTYTYHEGSYGETDTKQLTGVKEAGNYYIKLIGAGNFTGVRRLKLTVLATASGTSSDAAKLKPISKVSITRIPVQSYQAQSKDGAVTPELTVNDGTNKLTKGVNYEASYSNNTKPGTAYAIIKGIEAGGYSGTKRVSFKITGVAISKAAIDGLSSQTFIYGGTNIEPELSLSVKLNGTEIKLNKDTDYSIKWDNNLKAGTATVIITGKNGYTGTVKKKFKIKPFDIAQNKGDCFTAALKSDTVPYAKGGAKPELTVTFKRSDGKTQTLEEGKDYGVTYKNNKALNDASRLDKLPTVIIKGKGNFAGTYANKLTYKITPQNLNNLKLIAADRVYQNKGNIYATKVSIIDVDGKKLKAGRDYDKKLVYTYKEGTAFDDGTFREAGTVVSKDDIIPAGTTIVVTATVPQLLGKEQNYTGSCSGEYSIKAYDISKAQITIPKQTYTGRAITLDKTDEKQILVKVKGQKVDSSQFEIVKGSYKNNVKKGTASVTIKGIDNYGGSKIVKFTIKAKGFAWWKK